MGRNNKAYSKDLHQQAYDRLKGMQAFGESKKAAMAEGTAGDKIFSFNTYKTYWKHIKYFLAYVKETHPEITTLKKAKKYVPEWLQSRVDQNLSAWTVQTEEAALNKLYGIQVDDPDRFQAPKRKREDIKRSRTTTVRDKHFSVTNNDELIKFCKGTGVRRSELVALQGSDIASRTQLEDRLKALESIRDQGLSQEQLGQVSMLKDALMFQNEYFIYVRNGKGGRQRLSPIIGPNATQIIERIKNTPPDEKVWQHVSSNADIHGYRAEYATAIYKANARKLEDIPFDKVNKGTGNKYQSEVYTCRKDESGRKLDKAAMLLCSKALGHNRIYIVADNYLRGM